MKTIYILTLVLLLLLMSTVTASQPCDTGWLIKKAYIPPEDNRTVLRTLSACSIEPDSTLARLKTIRTIVYGKLKGKVRVPPNELGIEFGNNGWKEDCYNVTFDNKSANTYPDGTTKDIPTGTTMATTVYDETTNKTSVVNLDFRPDLGNIKIYIDGYLLNDGNFNPVKTVHVKDVALVRNATA